MSNQRHGVRCTSGPRGLSSKLQYLCVHEGTAFQPQGLLQYFGVIVPYIVGRGTKPRPATCNMPLMNPKPVPGTSV